MRCLVIGYGSIGSRHAAVFERLGHEAGVVTGRRLALPFPCFDSIDEAVKVFCPRIIVVANATDRHFASCVALENAGFKGLALIEKPLFAAMPAEDFFPAYTACVGYNLRFHPAVLRLRELLAGRRIFSAQLSVGQYLPQWRPGGDYRAGYSANPDRGGGVLRDLSHELDLALWLFGGFEKVSAVLGRFGELEIASEDTADIIMQCARCPSVNIHLDYQNLFPRRRLVVQASGLSVEVDLIAGAVRTQSGEERAAAERDATYTAQAEALARNDRTILCSWAEGLEVLRCIEAVEAAAAVAGGKGSA